MTSSEPETDFAPTLPSSKERVILASSILAIGLIALGPCLCQQQLVDYYATKLIPDMAALIPAALHRYMLWIGACLITLACLSEKLIYGLPELPFKKRMVTGCTLAFLLCVLLLTRSWQFPYCIDDAYIVFRYVDNMLRFGVPDYDIGQHVNTISSQLQFVILLLTAFITGQRNLPVVSESVNLAEEVISLFLLFAVLKRGFNSDKLALYGCSLHVLSAYAILEVMRGKEGPLVIMAIYLLLWAQLTKNALLKAWVSAMLILIRPEGLLVCALSFLSDIRDHLKKPLIALKNWLPPAVMLGIVFTWIYIYYGTLMLQGIKAKSVIYHPPPMVALAGLSSQLTTSLAGLPYYAWGLLGPLVLLFFYGLTVLLLWRYQFLRLYIVSIFVLTAFFGFGQSFMNAFPWYMSWWAPLVPLLYVGLISLLEQQQRRDIWTKVTQGLVISFSLIVVPLRSYLWEPFSEVMSPLPVFYWDNINDRLRIYEVARSYLNKVAKKSETLAVVEVGVIGYGLESKIFDLLGLVTPEVLKLYPVPEDKRAECGCSIPPEYARIYKPERILTLDCFCRNGLFEDEYFKKNYHLEWWWDNNAFGSLGVALYKKIPTDSSSQKNEIGKDEVGSDKTKSGSN